MQQFCAEKIIFRRQDTAIMLLSRGTLNTEKAMIQVEKEVGETKELNREDIKNQGSVYVESFR